MHVATCLDCEPLSNGAIDRSSAATAAAGTLPRFTSSARKPIASDAYAVMPKHHDAVALYASHQHVAAEGVKCALRRYPTARNIDCEGAAYDALLRAAEVFQGEERDFTRKRFKRRCHD
jgi:hypothetical protein